MTFELEAWADFLPFGAKQPSIDHVVSTSNLVEANITEEALQYTRKTIVKRLQEAGVELNVMVLNTSKFHHVGTMAEYLDLCCVDPYFREELGIAANDDLHHMLAEATTTIHNDPVSGEVDGQLINNPNREVHIKHSKEFTATIWKATDCKFALPKTQTKDEHLPLCCIAAPALLEFCSVGEDVHVGSRSILSNVSLPASTKIPDTTCMFTLRLQIPGPHTTLGELDMMGYVTFVFSTEDDIKYTTESDQLLVYGDIPMSYVRHPRAPHNSAPKISLWDSQVYPVTKTEKDATRLALEMLERISTYKKGGLPQLNTVQDVSNDVSTNDDECIVGFASLADAVTWKAV